MPTLNLHDPEGLASEVIHQSARLVKERRHNQALMQRLRALESRIDTAENQLATTRLEDACKAAGIPHGPAVVQTLLRREGYFGKRPEDYNLPSPELLRANHFIVRETTTHHPQRGPMTQRVPLATPSGIRWLANWWKQNHQQPES